MKNLKRFAIALVLACTMCLLAACATAPANSSGGSTTAQPQANLTPAQIVAIVCPPLTTAVNQLQSIYATQASLGNASAAKVSDALAKASPLVAQACAVGAVVTTSTIQNFATNALPQLAQIAGTLPLTQKQHDDVVTALLTAQVALGVYNVVQSQMQAAQSANASQ